MRVNLTTENLVNIGGKNWRLGQNWFVWMSEEGKSEQGKSNGTYPRFKLILLFSGMESIVFHALLG